MADTRPVGMTALIPSDNPHIHTCPYCGARLLINATSCRICGGPEPVPLEQTIRELLPSLDDDLAALSPGAKRARPAPARWRKAGNWSLIGLLPGLLGLWFVAWCLLSCSGGGGTVAYVWLFAVPASNHPSLLSSVYGGELPWFMVLFEGLALLAFAQSCWHTSLDDTWSRAMDQRPWAPWRC